MGDSVRERDARQIAILEGPLLIHVPPGYLRLRWSLDYSETWDACPPVAPAILDAHVVSDGWCPQ